MKKIRMALPALAIAGLLSFKNQPAATIKGTVTPAWYGVHAWAVSKTDTLYTTITDGNFEFTNAEPGEYRIIIEARPPYRNLAKDGIVVKDGQPTDVELSLQKWE